jgi:hypothetical protein
MTIEHRRRTSKVPPANSDPIPTPDYPIQRADSNPKSSSLSARFCERARPFLTEARTHIKAFGIRPISTPIRKRFSPFLLDSALPVEFRVTHSKQRVGRFLPDTRTHISTFGTWPSSAPFCKRTRPFLTESAPQVEFGLTCSKQRTGKFLTEARTHIRISGIWSKSAQNPAPISTNLNTAKLSEESWLRQ